MKAVRTPSPLSDVVEKYRLQLSESETLRDLVFELLEVENLDQALELACRQARELSGASGTAILLHDPHHGHHWSESSGTAASTDDVRTTSGTASEPSGTIKVPLHLRGQERGYLMFLFEDSDLRCDPRLMQRYAQEMSRAIEHIQFHEQQELLAVLEERHKLAQELHDSVTQSLYGVTMYGEAAARMLESGNPAKASELLHELCETSLEGLREARRMLYELRPPALTDEGLVPSLEARLSAVERRTGLQAELVVDPDISLSSEEEAEIFGITIEALNNVIRHAGARHVIIRLEACDSAIRLEVVDDGRGFDTTAAELEQGMGLAGMRDRAARIGGEISVSSSPGAGSRIELEIPAVCRKAKRATKASAT